jgi:hypothetical protein
VATTDEATATERMKATVGMKWMSMTVVVIDAVFVEVAFVEVASMLDVVVASVSGGCVLVGRWVGPHCFHCLTPFYSAGYVCCISFFFQSPFYCICSSVNSKSKTINKYSF